jgi:hypothetical protein
MISISTHGSFIPVVLDDLHSFDPSSLTWTAVVPSGNSPSGRYSFGFTAAPDGIVYLFGGCNGEHALSRIFVQEFGMPLY